MSQELNFVNTKFSKVTGIIFHKSKSKSWPTGFRAHTKFWGKITIASLLLTIFFKSYSWFGLLLAIKEIWVSIWWM